MDLTPENIQRFKKISTPKLKIRAQNAFNAFIRKRDEGQPCICCDKWGKLQAGHFYSAGKYNHMRFEEDNVHGQLKGCNYFKSGNLLEYRKRLIVKIGEKRLARLDEMASYRVTQKTDRFKLIEVILKYE